MIMNCLNKFLKRTCLLTKLNNKLMENLKNNKKIIFSNKTILMNINIHHWIKPSQSKKIKIKPKLILMFKCSILIL